MVLTGGPGAGKTAVLDIARRMLCKHVEILPEAAGILFGGGFPRRGTLAGRQAAQCSIFHVQKQLEWLGENDRAPGLLLCDRGTLDGLAYWPSSAEDFFSTLGTTREAELARYALVVHLRTPMPEHGYSHSNPLRIETAEEARAIDERILAAWEGHPRRVIVNSHASFLEKARHVLEVIFEEAPDCGCSGQTQAEPPTS